MMDNEPPYHAVRDVQWCAPKGCRWQEAQRELNAHGRLLDLVGESTGQTSPATH